MTEINIEVNIDEEKWVTELPAAEEIIRQACIAAINATKIIQHADNIEVSILLTNDVAMRKFNNCYRDKDQPTNVLSFPQEQLAPGKYKNIKREILLGDVIFSLETIKREVIAENKSFSSHLTHLAIHGTLHLLGYDHEKDKDAAIMETLEIKVLEELGIGSPY